MKISLSWLRDFVPYTGSVEELSDILTHLGLSVESVERISAPFTKVVVGKVVSAEKVAGSDHLTFCQVEAGVGELLPIVCGAPNVAAGQTVPVALVGATLPGDFTITERKLRGVVSKGMICSERELGLSEDHAGILVMDDSLVIGTPVEQVIGAGDVVLDLEVTFNRPDCLCHLGVAREVAAKTGLPLTMPKAEPLESSLPASETVSVKILDQVRCPRYTARVVKGVKIAPSPNWLQDRLRAVGIRPISNVVDVTNYVMMELGHPLHAFDYHLVKNGGIVVRSADSGEKFTTLDAKVHALSDTDLLIADSERGIALAGVMGGLNSEINVATQDVLIECAYFEPTSIRTTSRDRGIQTESSRRFERGVDIEMTAFAAARAAHLIQQLAGGEVLSGEVDAYPVKRTNRQIKLRSLRVNQILGAALPQDLMAKYLSALACKVVVEKEGAEGILAVEPPSWRRDLEREIDLIEEVIRLHGYNEVGLATRSAVPLEVDPDRDRQRQAVLRLKDTLVEFGLFEAISWSLTSLTDAERFPTGRIPVRVINPLSEDLSTLRTTPAIALLKAVERNLNVGNPNVRLFEWGKCFWTKEGDIHEENRLGIVLVGEVRPESWIENGRAFGIHDLQGLATDLVSRLRLDNVQMIPYDIPEFLSQGASLRTGTNTLGHFGQIAPEITARFGIERSVWYIELEGDSLIAKMGQTPSYKPLPKYPTARRDLAFLVSRNVEVGTLQTALSKAGGVYLVSVELFDLYRDKGIAQDKQSLAFHLNFRSSERTLGDAEVDRAIENMVKAATELGADLRQG